MTVRDRCLLGALLAVHACAAPSAHTFVPSIADDSAVYVTLVAPDSQGGRGRAVAAPIDLRRMTDGARIGGALARRAPGFDSTLVAVLHRTVPDGRGPGAALHSRPTLLWSAPGTASATAAKASGGAIADMEHYETDPERISLRYSAVQYSSDGQWAVVLEERVCGPLCGAMRYVVLRRAADDWRVVTELVTVVS